MTQNELQRYVIEKTERAKQASRKLVLCTTEEKNEALLEMADTLWRERERILMANQKDIQAARAAGTPEGKLDRLRLNESRLLEMIEGLRQIVELDDPVGEVLETFQRPNGLKVEKVRVPFGVIAMVYESRPNVTVDAAGLALKTGNAVVLRGGKEALRSNHALIEALTKGLRQSNVPPEAIQFIDRPERETVDFLIRAKNTVDLAIPRGGAGLIQRVIQNALVPVIETGVGNCHVYVHQAADPERATRIVVNAKTGRPSVCNSIETVLVDEAIAPVWLPQASRDLAEKGVELRGCEKTCEILRHTPGLKLVPASEADYATEFLDLTLAVKVVSGLEEAVAHIEKFGTRHSEAIVTEDNEAAKAFLAQVDAAAVYHNASTRFTDGFEFGYGAEIGISTQKLHARGPMGLKELTSYKYRIRGTGQVRE
ncbi:glutamate-5-semialdehyde dehydrogenase [Thermoactinomyces sp. CICC 10522]|jgi:glutamate-5-semialdehyde dehydrogenase|uniref:glutamate-5-semialdehyde dehydrogenase n=1 Tax=Thermoactinomyces sp. CICC 10522 TaxID=2767427 RepID=UPI0018DE189C|nr:glutamate-5-semialdehyde dehydrogenase [Thermoactinomyces sp. CICC 10522]MBH8603703.1 glutamate-5-semialdehyde dehydrogenase [Thermoactinomyces sp. CICC 10522]